MLYLLLGFCFVALFSNLITFCLQLKGMVFITEYFFFSLLHTS